MYYKGIRRILSLFQKLLINPMEYFTAISTIATAIGVILVFIQLYLNNKTERSRFENDISQRFISITNSITYKVIFIKSDDGDFKSLVESKLDGFYEYFDLTNQEIFLHQKRKISNATWDEWSSGIEEMMKLNSFKYAWEIISKQVTENTFTQLRGFLKGA